jgi:hypothetical protein
MPRTPFPNIEEAQVIALKILGFIAKDEARLEVFLKTTGCLPAAVAALADKPHFQAGVCDYLLANQSLLLVFAEMEDIRPETISQARRLLPGSSDDV